MKRKFKIERRELELLKDFIKLYRKYNNSEDKDLYDEQLMSILEEYCHITYYRKEMRKK